jgi:hypothetical protein
MEKLVEPFCRLLNRRGAGYGTARQERPARSINTSASRVIGLSGCPLALVVATNTDWSG